MWIETANLFLLMNLPEFLILTLPDHSIDSIVGFRAVKWRTSFIHDEKDNTDSKHVSLEPIVFS